MFQKYLNNVSEEHIKQSALVPLYQLVEPKKCIYTLNSNTLPIHLASVACIRPNSRTNVLENPYSDSRVFKDAWRWWNIELRQYILIQTWFQIIYSGPRVVSHLPHHQWAAPVLEMLPWTPDLLIIFSHHLISKYIINLRKKFWLDVYSNIYLQEPVFKNLKFKYNFKLMLYLFYNETPDT